MKEAIFAFLGALPGVLITALVSLYITKIQESNKFKLVALDKRLKVHQEAYTLLIGLFVFFEEIIHSITVINFMLKQETGGMKIVYILIVNQGRNSILKKLFLNYK